MVEGQKTPAGESRRPDFRANTPPPMLRMFPLPAVSREGDA